MIENRNGTYFFFFFNKSRFNLICCSHKLEKSFITDLNSSLQEADIIGVIHDVSSVWNREKLDIKVIKMLEAHVNTPSFLVLNKVNLKD